MSEYQSIGGRNSEVVYEAGNSDELSFEFRLCKEAGLSYPVAKKVEFYGCGYRPVIDKLIATSPQTPQELEDYVKSLNCWVDGNSEDTSEEIMNALAEHFGV